MYCFDCLHLNEISATTSMLTTITKQQNNTVNIDGDAPIIALISNCLSEEHRFYIRNSNNYCAEGVLEPYGFSYKKDRGIIPVLDILPTEMLSISGMKKAKEYFVNAVRYAVSQEVRVVLLAASTKRLFGDGTELKAMFPDVLFTIGDNGTAMAFLKQIAYVTKNIKKDAPIVVLGAGFLGEAAIEYLKGQGYSKIVIISKHRVKSKENDFQFASLNDYIDSDVFQKASLFLGCAHNHNVTKQQLNAIANTKLILIDVAVPNAVPADLIDEDSIKFTRFDGGDYEIKNLNLEFDHRLMGLSFKTEFYGCFTEAFLLAISKYKGDADFFKVNKANMKLVSNLVKNFGDDISVSHRNFGKKVNGFQHNLALEN